MSQPNDPAAFLKALIACRSVTPAEGGAHAWMADVLGSAGFKVERLTFSAPGTPDVQNLFATIGSGAPHLVFAGHTDVVPPGDEARWSHPPFAGEVADGLIYGRGAVDMKGGIAASWPRRSAASPRGAPAGTLSLLITGDEEGPAINGTVKLIDWARKRGHRFDAALVGEPTSREKLGDTIKIGRRGTLSGKIAVTGRQGHAAYPHLADNPLPRLIRILDAADEAHARRRATPTSSRPTSKSPASTSAIRPSTSSRRGARALQRALQRRLDDGDAERLRRRAEAARAPPARPASNSRSAAAPASRSSPRPAR